MVLNEPIYQRTRGPVRLLALFVLLQMAVTLLTNGFTLYFDEAIWHYIGRNWFRHGLVPYSGGVDNKSPLIFAIYGLSDRLFGVNYWFPRIVGTACQTVGLWYVYKLADRLAGRQTGVLALQLYGLSLLWHATNGKYASLTETYEVTGIIVAVYLFLTTQTKGGLLLSGIAAAAGCAFRLTGLFGVLAIFLYSARRRRREGGWFGLGLVTGVLFLAALAMLAGIHLSDFFLYGFRDNFGAHSPTDHPLSWKADQLAEKFFYSEMVLLYPGAIAYVLLKRKADLFVLWAVAAFAGVCGLGMPDAAHLKDILPPLCLMNAIVIQQSIERYGLPVRPLLLLLWLVFFPKTTEPLIAGKALLAGPNEHPEKDCLATYPQPDNYARKTLGWWIKSVTTPQDLVLVAGDGAQVQVYSERRSPSIYFNATETDLARGRFRTDLLANPPAMIVVPLSDAYRQNTDEGTRRLIDSLVSGRYSDAGCHNGYTIYRRRDNP